MSLVMIVSSDSYFKITLSRCCNALKSGVFWREFIAVFIFGTLGLWLPVFFNWSSSTSLLEPKSLFIFGVATLVMVVEKRMFMCSSQDNKFTTITKSFVLFGSIGAVIVYGKAMTTLESENWAVGAMLLTVFIWLYNFVNNSTFDNNALNGSLGGDI